MSRIALPSQNGRRGIAAFAVVVVLALISISIVGMIMGNARDFDVTVTR